MIHYFTRKTTIRCYIAKTSLKTCPRGKLETRTRNNLYLLKLVKKTVKIAPHENKMIFLQQLKLVTQHQQQHYNNMFLHIDTSVCV